MSLFSDRASLNNRWNCCVKSTLVKVWHHFSHHSLENAFEAFFKTCCRGRLVFLYDSGRLFLHDNCFVQVDCCVQILRLWLFLHQIESFLAQILANIFEPLLFVAKVQPFTIDHNVLKLFNRSLMSFLVAICRSDAESEEQDCPIES